MAKTNLNPNSQLQNHVSDFLNLLKTKSPLPLNIQSFCDDLVQGVLSGQSSDTLTENLINMLPESWKSEEVKKTIQNFCEGSSFHFTREASRDAAGIRYGEAHWQQDTHPTGTSAKGDFTLIHGEASSSSPVDFKALDVHAEFDSGVIGGKLNASACVLDTRFGESETKLRITGLCGEAKIIDPMTAAVDLLSKGKLPNKIGSPRLSGDIISVGVEHIYSQDQNCDVHLGASVSLGSLGGGVTLGSDEASIAIGTGLLGVKIKGQKICQEESEPSFSR